uniref:Apple domain-containing protein n=1 Tax=viral metagenome TaxID=1070528 RepID=A0A6C0E1X1_9ZZZZ
MNNNNDDKLESINIQIETLEKEYMLILKQYETAYANYISNLNSQQQEPNNSDSFSAFQGRTYWGTYGIKEGSAGTQKECESMCLSDTKCTGATFNPSKRYCWTRGGDSGLTVGTDSDYALIPKIKENLILLKNLNQRLMDLNKRISNKLSMLYPLAKEETNTKNEKQNELIQSYSDLVNEQTHLESVLKEYETLEDTLKNNTLYVTQKNMSLRIWVILAIILLVITLKIMVPMSELSGTLVVAISMVVILYIAVNYK